MNSEKHEGCPSCASVAMAEPAAAAVGGNEIKRLSHWPIQIKLIGTIAPFLNNADLLVAADGTAFATPYFHSEFLEDHEEPTRLTGLPVLGRIARIETAEDAARKQPRRRLLRPLSGVSIFAGLNLFHFFTADLSSLTAMLGRFMGKNL